jgi:hypothetical protein
VLSVLLVVVVWWWLAMMWAAGGGGKVRRCTAVHRRAPKELSQKNQRPPPKRKPFHNYPLHNAAGSIVPTIGLLPSPRLCDEYIGGGNSDQNSSIHQTK